jgi:UPF0176 protein
MSETAATPNTPEPSAWTVAALYKFATVEDVPALRDTLLALGESLGLCGTMLVAQEGINGTIAGTSEAVAATHDFLRADARFAKNLSWKLSDAAKKPFAKWKVKLKREIVTLGVPEADPSKQVGSYVKPGDWNALITRDDVVLVDTRNDYEVKLGTFTGAIDPKTENFRDFPQWVADNLDPEKHPKVAMFCTGGIRCEKASSLLLTRGFKEVFHLEGGILKYIEEVPEADSTWRGECFVFDERIALKHGLKQGETGWCHHCDNPVGRNEIHACKA